MFVLGVLVFFITFIAVILIGELLLNTLIKIIQWYEKTH